MVLPEPKLIWDAGGGVARGFIVSIAQKKSEHPCEVHGAGNLQAVGANLIINSALGRDLSLAAGQAWAGYVPFARPLLSGNAMSSHGGNFSLIASTSFVGIQYVYL